MQKEKKSIDNDLWLAPCLPELFWRDPVLGSVTIIGVAILTARIISRPFFHSSANGAYISLAVILIYCLHSGRCFYSLSRVNFGWTLSWAVWQNLDKTVLLVHGSGLWKFTPFQSSGPSVVQQDLLLLLLLLLLLPVVRYWLLWFLGLFWSWHWSYSFSPDENLLRYCNSSSSDPGHQTRCWLNSCGQQILLNTSP